MRVVSSLPIFLLGLAFGAGVSVADLVGHWKFDEGGGTTYADSSPNGNDARPPGGGAGWTTDAPTTGFANTSSLEFDGAGAYVSTPFVGIGGNSARTIACWIKTTHTAEHGIVAWGLSTTNGAKWHFRVNSSAANGPLGALRTETQGDFTIGSTVVSDGTWHHVACVYPGGGGELATVQHYVDGVLEVPGGNNASTQAVNTSTTSDLVTIGRRTQGAADHYFPGKIDDVRIYDRALSGPEISALMGAMPTTEGLLFHMPFEEGGGETVDDVGSGDHDGMLIAPEQILPSWSSEAPPHLNGSLHFADAGDLLFTDYPGIAGSASRSVAFWFKTTMLADNGIVAWGNSAVNGFKWHARLNSTSADGPVGALRLEIQGGRAVATTSVADDEWHHAAIVFEEDADPDINDLVFYLDGEVDPISQFGSVPINTQTEGVGALAVTLGGRYQGATLRGFDGNLADVRIYDTGLSQAEVQAIMMGGAGVRMQLEVSRAEGELRIGWASQEGMHYTVRSETDLTEVPLEEWPVFGGLANLPATPPRNAVSFPLPVDAERYFVVEEIPPPPMIIFGDDFENVAPGWTQGSDDQPGTVWELGMPTLVGPPAAQSPTNCFGTNLSAIYTLSANVWLRTPEIDLTTAEEATLNYSRWIEIEEMFDAGRVAVLDADDYSELAVLETAIDGASTGWEAVSRKIPAGALGRIVVIEFRLVTDDIDLASYAGFYVDDVSATVP